MKAIVLAVERAYVDAVIGAGRGSASVSDPATVSDPVSASVPVSVSASDPVSVADAAVASAGAVASRYLAVGTPRSLGLIADSAADVHAAIASLAAHRVWFQPRDLRCAGAAADALAAAIPDARAVALAEALAADIVCIHAPGLTLAAAQLRRGTHVNVLAPTTLDPQLAQLAMIAHETAGPHATTTLGQLAAGLVDGRVLDELTIFVLGDAAIARAAVADLAEIAAH